MDNRLFRICDDCGGTGLLPSPRKGTSRACRACVLRSVRAVEYNTADVLDMSKARGALRRLLQLARSNATDAIAYLDALAKPEAWK